MQLLFESTIADTPVDLNTYIKILSQVYFDYEVQFERKDFITYLYTLMANDHTIEDFQLGTELLQQYIENHYGEVAAANATGDSQSQQTKGSVGKSKKGKSKGSVGQHISQNDTNT